MGVGVGAALHEVEVEGVDILRAVAVGPPEFWIRYVEDGCGFGIEGDGLGFLWLEGDFLRELNRIAGRTAAEVAFEGAGLRLVGGVLEGGLDGDVGGIGYWQREVGDDEGIFDEDRA